MKRASDSHLGLPSQCFVTRKASIGVPQARGRPQYCSNLVSARLHAQQCVGCSCALQYRGEAKLYCQKRCRLLVTHPAQAACGFLGLFHVSMEQTAGGIAACSKVDLL